MRSERLFAAWLCLCAVGGIAAGNLAAQDLTGGLEGTFVVQTRAGASVAPPDTKVWILYGPSHGCMVGGQLRGPVECHLELAADTFKNEEFACEKRLSKQMDPIRARLNEVKHAQNDAEERKNEELSGQLNAYYTRCGDAAIAKTMAWADKHPKDSWQARVVSVDATGRWTAAGLKTGDYILVFRASLDKFEVYSLNEKPLAVEAGQTVTVPQVSSLLSPRAQAH